MGGKREKPEGIVLKLRQVAVLQGQGRSVSEAVRQIGVTVQTGSSAQLMLKVHVVNPL